MWLVAVVFVTTVAAGLVWLPYYGDHALFASMGREIIGGRIPYTEAWDVKQPGIFLWYGAATALSEKSVAIVTFALCGFANFSSIAIQMAVTGGLAPNQRPLIARLGLKALAAGSLSNLMSAALAGLFLSL